MQAVNQTAGSWCRIGVGLKVGLGSELGLELGSELGSELGLGWVDIMVVPIQVGSRLQCVDNIAVNVCRAVVTSQMKRRRMRVRTSQIWMHSSLVGAIMMA